MVLILAMKSFLVLGQEKENSNASDAKAEFYDQAMFRIPGKVLFYNKALETISSIKRLKCLRKNPLIYKSIGFDKVNFKLGTSALEWRNNRDLTDKLVLLEKLKSFGLTGVEQDQRTVDEKLSKTNCRVKQGDTKEQIFLELVRVELFLQTRFLENNKVSQKGLKTFIDSISGKSKHEYLY